MLEHLETTFGGSFEYGSTCYPGIAGEARARVKERIQRLTLRVAENVLETVPVPTIELPNSPANSSISPEPQEQPDALIYVSTKTSPTPEESLQLMPAPTTPLPLVANIPDDGLANVSQVDSVESEESKVPSLGYLVPNLH